ncbi:hypothetical protein E2562_028127 [Oryza meyeriana var. granulata]|uniref:FAF domain-containing protein n=1 Tax=Oryza meyeriana var. granulata TaxID=110450 RepID=A0A6G1C9I6_9ORYZ|nr:hypothetical protein E2562_028127 [Oryza meyeriana var. granulata]
MLRRAASMDSGYRRREAVWSCTESLGSESGDVGACDSEIVDHQSPAAAAAAEEEEEEEKGCAGRVGEQATSPEKRRRTERRLPPAMPRAAEAFMRAERRGGRLILTEVVRAERRREVFRASRADGRLQLRFAEDKDAPDDGDEDTVSEPAAAETESVATSGGSGVVVSGCCNDGGFCQVAAGAGRRLEIGAVMGI